MDYPQEIKAHTPSIQDVYQGSEIKKGSKNMPLGNKAVAIAKNPAQLAVVSDVLSDVFYNGDISQGGGLRGSTGYGKNTTQHRPNRSSKNKDRNQETDKKFPLGPVYQDLEEKILEALLPVQLQGDLRSKQQVYNFSEHVFPKRSGNTDQNTKEAANMKKEIMAGISISWKQLDKENVIAVIHVSNEQDLNVLKSKLNDYTFGNINIELDFTINFLENNVTDTLKKRQQYIIDTFDVTLNMRREQEEINNKGYLNKKIYNRSAARNVGTQEYAEYVALENERNERVSYIKQLLTESRMSENYFDKPVNSMTLDELLQLDLAPLEDIVNFTNTAADASEDFSQYGLDAYYKGVVDTLNKKITDRQITEAMNAKLTDDELKSISKEWNKYEIGGEDKVRAEQVQLLSEYAEYLQEIGYTRNDSKKMIKDMERMGHLLLDESNVTKLLEYLGPSGQKQVHINKFLSFVTKHNLWGKSFKDVSNAIFHVQY